MVPILPLGLGAAALLWMLTKKSAPGGGAGAPHTALVPQHRYAFVVRSDVQRMGATFDQITGLASRIAQLGFTAVFLDTQQAEADPFVWHGVGTWSGARPALADGLGVFFVGVSDLEQGTRGKYDPGLPPEDEQTVDRMLAPDGEQDPQKLREEADALRGDGFPIAAAALDTKANALAFVTPGGAPAGAGIPVPGGMVAPAPPTTSYPSPGYPGVPASPPPPSPGGLGVILGGLSVSKIGGPLPALPPIPPAGRQPTDAHRAGQRGLIAWAAQTRATAYTGPVDGIIGPNTQHATQLFQRWANQNRHAGLVEDGLFGPQTYAQLATFAR